MTKNQLIKEIKNFGDKDLLSSFPWNETLYVIYKYYNKNQLINIYNKLWSSKNAEFKK